MERANAFARRSWGFDSPRLHSNDRPMRRFLRARRISARPLGIRRRGELERGISSGAIQTVRRSRAGLARDRRCRRSSRARRTGLASAENTFSDQERAKVFYVDQLGFELVREDDSMPELRWTQVRPQGGHTSLVLVDWFESMPAGVAPGARARGRRPACRVQTPRVERRSRRRPTHSGSAHSLAWFAQRSVLSWTSVIAAREAPRSGPQLAGRRAPRCRSLAPQGNRAAPPPGFISGTATCSLMAPTPGQNSKARRPTPIMADAPMPSWKRTHAGLSRDAGR